MKRVDDIISETMARFPGVSRTAQAEYYEEVHQHLAPLARELEIETDRLKQLLRAESDRVLHFRDVLRMLAAVARRYLPDYDEHPALQAADDLLDGTEARRTIAQICDGFDSENPHIGQAKAVKAAWVAENADQS